MNAFRANCSAARPVADVLGGELEEMLFQDEAQIEAFIAKTQALGREIAEQLHNGRDQLLELNSFRKDEAELWVEQLKRYEKEALLWPYMEAVFECYGVDTEFHSPDCFIVRPSDHLRIAHFPGLDEDGVTVTVKRACALAREDMQFLTWEHPMVTAAMDLVLSSETGNAVVSVVKHRDLRPGQFLLECLFIVECSAPAQLQIGRFLPPTPIRVLIDQHQQDLTEVFSHQQLPETGKAFDKQQIAAFLNSQRKPLSKLLHNAEELARVRMQALTAEANATMLESLSAEVKRMARLKKVNPSIKAEEIEQLKDLTMLAHESIQAAQLRLDAVRFVIAS
jgi:ATP-dependent helicase HepA